MPYFKIAVVALKFYFGVAYNNKCPLSAKYIKIRDTFYDFAS